MRVQLHNDTQSGQYATALLKIGEGRMTTDANGMITINQEFCNAVHNLEDLKNNVYPGLEYNMRNREWLCEKAILAPTNEIVGQINEQMMSHVQGDVVEYLSVDIVMDSEQVTSYHTEFLNSLELLLRVPSHKLRLKIGVPVLLMRNLEAPRLCNGTRLQITQLGRNIIRAIIMTGIAKDEQVLIPRIPMIPTDLPFQFKRIQFPLKPAFAMTINKAQGQTLKMSRKLVPAMEVELTPGGFLRVNDGGEGRVLLEHTPEGRNLQTLSFYEYGARFPDHCGSP
ncbi:hypothetical protein evm_014631 [Chilo suppressalis]|nr:hypothetical protein evm_014631 [Chilo suppressalis]